MDKYLSTDLGKVNKPVLGKKLWMFFCHVWLAPIENSGDFFIDDMMDLLTETNVQWTFLWRWTYDQRSSTVGKEPKGPDDLGLLVLRWV